MTPNEIGLCAHSRAFVGLDATYCPDCRTSFPSWTTEYQHLLASPTLTSLQVSADFPLPPETLESAPLTLSKSENSSELFLSETLKKPNCTMTSERLTQQENPGMLQQSDSPAQEHPALVFVPDLNTLIAPCGGKPSESLKNHSHDLSSSRIQKVCDIEDLPGFSTALPAAGTWDLGSVYQQPKLERPIKEKEFLLLPTITASDGKPGQYRPAGGNKLTTRLRKLGLLLNSQVLNAEVVELMQGFPMGWTSLLELSETIKVSTGDENKCLGEQLSPAAPLCLSKESSTSIALPLELTDDEAVSPSVLRSVGKGSPILQELSEDTESCNHQWRGVWEGDCVLVDLCDHCRKTKEPTIQSLRFVLKQVTKTRTDYAQSKGFKSAIPLMDEQIAYLQRQISCYSDELSEDEERELKRLETKIERAFYEAGAALREIRDRKLYRSTHKTFEEYCKERFGMKQSRSYQLIDAAIVVENLQKVPQFVELLPTNESQCRPLTKLEPEEQVEVWKCAIELGKRPSGQVVKGIVEQIKERDNTPPPLEYCEGDVVEIRSGGSSTLRKHDGMWGIITHVGTWSYKVYVSLRDVELQCKGNELNRVDEESKAEIKAVSDRIKILVQRDDLATTALSFLDALARKTCFTEDDLWFLEKVEERYRITAPSRVQGIPPFNGGIATTSTTRSNPG